jgi:hypothetical protein
MAKKAKTRKPARKKQPEVSGKLGSVLDPQARYFGSHPLALKPPADILDPDPDRPPPPPPPLPASVPDTAFQFRPCLEQLGVPGLKDQVIAAVRRNAGAMAKVDYACINGSGRLGIWTRGTSSDAADAARKAGLQVIDVLGPGGGKFAVWINATYVRRTVFDGWTKSPQVLDGDGKPDPDGPLHIGEPTVEFRSPNKIITRVPGYDERPWPDVDFTFTIADTLFASGTEVMTQTVRDLDTDDWHILAAGLAWLLGSLVTPWFFIGFAVFGAQAVAIAQADAPNQDGAGSQLAARLPREIMLDIPLKLALEYTGTRVDPGGLTAFGDLRLVPRMPEVQIIGPRQIRVNEGETSVVASYRAEVKDTRNPVYQWSGDGKVINPAAAATSIRFSTATMRAGMRRTRHIRIDITDAGGLHAEHAEAVTIYMVRPSDTSIPPICIHRPWLPQCQDG